MPTSAPVPSTIGRRRTPWPRYVDLRSSWCSLTRIAEREKQFVDALQGALGIDGGMAMKIIEVLLVMSRA